MKLTIGYFYPKDLNLYGDNGNVEILEYRARKRGIATEVIELATSTDFLSSSSTNINLVFMGGGPDSGQKAVYQDLISNKKRFFQTYLNTGGVGLFICGAYQLLGNYYKSADGSILEGLGIFDFYTEHFGNHKPRCIGNVKCNLAPQLVADPCMKQLPRPSNYLVGFENHGGRTYLSSGLSPLALVATGSGNNGDDKTEGLHVKNTFGTYLHGPILAKNPHFADFLLAKALDCPLLPPLDDTLVNQAHHAWLNM